MRGIPESGPVRALALVGMLMLSACGRELTPSEHLDRARSFVQNGEVKPALIELSNALQTDPNLREARRLRAELALQMGDGAAAERDARRSIELGFPRAEMLPIIVRALLLSGEFDKVLNETATLPDGLSAPDRAGVLAARGQAMIAKGRLGAAQSAIDDALAADAAAAPAQVAHALLLSMRRNAEGARAALVRAFEADPESWEAWSLLGEIELAAANAKAADEAFSRAIAGRQYIALDQAKRAMARLRLKDEKGAAKDLAALESQGLSSHPYVSYVAGLAHFQKERYREADAAFQVSFAGDPSFLPNRLYLAATKMLLGDFAQAANHAEAAYSAAPNALAAGRMLGAVQIRRADYAAAQNVLKENLRKAPRDPSTLRMLATLAMLAGDAEAGVEYATVLAALEPESDDAAHMLELSRLLSGKPLSDGAGGGKADAADGYTYNLLRALEAFRDKKIDEAAERAERLHLQHPDRVDPLNVMAASYIARGDATKARETLEKVLSLQANEPSATRNLARIESLQGNLPRAQALLEGRLKASPGDSEAALLLAELLERQGKRDASLAMLERTLKERPDASALRLQLAARQLELGRLAAVLNLTRNLNTAEFEREPRLWEVHGKALMRSGDAVGAHKAFQQWAASQSTSAQAQFYFGDSLARSGQAAAARESIQRAIAIDSGFLPARIGEIKLLVQAGENGKAKKALTRLRQDFGDNADVLGIEGWFALGTRDFDLAQQKFARAQTLKPDPEFAVLLGRAYWFRGKREEALGIWRDWVAANPSELTVQLELAEALMLLGRNDEARGTYEKVVSTYPNHVPSLNNLAWLNRDADLTRAFDLAQRAFQLAPGDAHVLDTLGMLTMKKGDIARAYELIRAAADRSPNDLQIQLHLGDVLTKLSRLQEARGVLETIVAKAPQSEPAKRAEALLADLERR